MPDPLITSESFESFEPEWSALHARVPGASPFLHPAFRRSWLNVFGEGVRPVFLSVRVGDELVGAVALEIDRDEARELGDHNVCDYAGPLALPGHEAAVASGLLEWLREDLTPALRTWGMPADSPLVPALSAATEAGGWSFEQAHEAVCPGVDLGGDFEAYVASLSKKDRHELRRKMRNFEAAGRVEFASVGEPDAVVGGLEALFHLMRISRGDKDEFLTGRMEEFFRELGRTFGALGMARLSTLSLDGTPVAMTLAFEDDRATYLYNSGYDPAYGHLSVGLVGKAYAIRDSIERGKTRFDFLRGEEEYKRRLGGIDREVVTLSLRSAR